VTDAPLDRGFFVDPFGESLSKKAGLVNADTRLLKVNLLPDSSISSPLPFYNTRRPFAADLFEFHSGFNYLAFPALDRKDTPSRSQLIRASVSRRFPRRFISRRDSPPPFPSI